MHFLAVQWYWIWGQKPQWNNQCNDKFQVQILAKVKFKDLPNSRPDVLHHWTLKRSDLWSWRLISILNLKITGPLASCHDVKRKCFEFVPDGRKQRIRIKWFVFIVRGIGIRIRQRWVLSATLSWVGIHGAKWLVDKMMDYIKYP